MKPLFVALLAAMLVHAAPALAQSAGASPLIGSWAVEVSRLPMSPEVRPKSVTIMLSDAGGGKWATQVEVVDAGGAKSHVEGISTLDGTPAPVKGNLEADLAAAKMPAPSVLIMMLGKGGVPASTRVYTAVADGKSMVETAAYFGQGGRPIMRTNYFTRVR